MSISKATTASAQTSQVSAGALAPHRPVSQAAEFLVDDGHERVERLPVARLPGEEKLGDR